MSDADNHAIVCDREPLVRMILEAQIYELEIVPESPVLGWRRQHLLSELRKCVQLLTEPN